MEHRDTLTEAMADARAAGFTRTFKVVEGGLQCEDTGAILEPGDLKIIGHHRFEGTSNPDDMSALYLVEGRDGVKGMIVDAYGTYSDADLSAFLRRVPMDEHP